MATSKITFRFVLIAFLIGAVVGTTGDFVHVFTQTDGYPKDGPFPFLPLLPVKMPVWVPLLFGTAVLLMAINHKLVSRFYAPRMAENKDLAYAAPLLFVVLYALSGFIEGGTGKLQDVWLGLFAIGFWLYADRTLTGAGMAVATAVIGTGFEMFLVHNKVFFYYPEHANFFGVPSWLPWLYVSASICTSLFARWI